MTSGQARPPRIPSVRGPGIRRRAIAALIFALALGGPATAQTAATDIRMAQAATLVQAGDFAAALPVLEAVVRDNPANTVARLELASVLLRLGQGTRARYHFALARGGNLAPQTRAVVDGLLTGVPLRRGWEGMLAFTLSPETNPARGSTGFLLVNGIPVEIGTIDAGKSGQSVRVNASIARQIPLSPATAFLAGASVEGEFNSGRLADIVTLRPVVALRLLRGGTRTELALRWTEQFADGAALAAGPGATLSHNRPLGPRGTLLLTGSVDRLRYAANPGLTGPQSAASITYIHAISPATRLSTGLTVTRRAAQSTSASYTSVRHVLGVSHSFRGGLTLGWTAARTRSWRDAPQGFFGVVQRDTRREMAITAQHARISLRGFAPTLTLGYEEQDSTIPLQVYDNSRLSLGLTRRF